MTLFDRPIAPETYAVIRYGMGFPARDVPLTPQAMIDRLLGPDQMAGDFPFVSFKRTLELGRTLRLAQKARKMDGGGQKKARNAINNLHAKTVTSDFARCVETNDPFRERLARFWMNHFTTRNKTVHLRTGHDGYQAEAIRPHLAGPFSELLKAAVTHPFMLLYLDQTVSVGPNSVAGLNTGGGLNENLAREVLELHTLGVGAGYTQTDVTEFAELLTGLMFTREKGLDFRPKRAEPGAETVLGKVYGGAGKAQLSDIYEALDDLARHPSTASFICTKLARYFTADQPDPGLVASMIATFVETDGYLAQVYAAMLDHPAAWSGFGAKVKWPVDYVASALRALGVRAADLQEIPRGQVQKHYLGPLRRMGQNFRSAPGPDGWPDMVADWVDPQGMAARIGFAMAAARRAPGKPPDPRDFVHSALGDAAGERLLFAAKAAESRAEGVGIILASAEFNRR
ncbi:MAG: DUF1800 domain-containing protein [Rhodobacter sp.]|nr:DUF1800 domain-containing protein [Rhodobacter sp.]